MYFEVLPYITSQLSCYPLKRVELRDRIEMFSSKDLIQMRDQISVSELLTLRSQSSRCNPFPFVSKDSRGCELQRLRAVCRQPPDLPGGVPTAHSVPEPIGLSSDYCPPQTQTGEWEAFALRVPDAVCCLGHCVKNLSWAWGWARSTFCFPEFISLLFYF